MMSRLRTVVSQGPRSWTRLTRFLVSTPTPVCGSQRALAYTSHLCFKRHEGRLEEKEKNWNAPLSTSTTVASSSSEFEDPGRGEQDKFDELMEPLQRNVSKSFFKECEYKLLEWGRIVKELQNQNKPVPLKKIVSNSFTDVVEFALTPQAPSEMRPKCLAILLSQPSDDPLTQKMLVKTADDAMQVPVKALADIVHSLTVCEPTALRKSVRLSLVTAVVEKRWYELGPRHIVFFMYQLDELFNVKDISAQLRAKARHKKEDQTSAPEAQSPAKDVDDESSNEWKESEVDKMDETSTSKDGLFMNVNLETRIITLMNELKVKDLARVVILQAKWRSRNETLLNAAVHRLSQADLTDFSFTQLSNLLVSSSFLNIQHAEFLQKLTNQLALCDPPTTSQASAILMSLSHLRWSAPDLATKCVKFLARHIDQISPRDAANVLMSLAVLYCLPGDEEEEKFIHDLTHKAQSDAKVSWKDKVNTVWCLAVLKCLTLNWVEVIFKSDLKSQNNLLQNDIAAFRKLQDVDRAAKLELTSYNGPFLADNIQKEGLAEDSRSSRGLLKTLRKFVDLATYVELSHGLPTDVLMLANPEGEVRALKGQGNEDVGTMHRLAIQHVPYTGSIQPTERPTGSYRMAERHLKLMGYIPVQIPYSELRPSLSSLEQINNIKARIKQAVVATVPSSSSSSISSPSSRPPPSSTSSSSSSSPPTFSTAPSSDS